jgi:predicted nucleotidyltransferase
MMTSKRPSTSPLDRRAEVARRVTDLLLADERVIAVTPYGSLANGSGDTYSDIDLQVRLGTHESKREVSDRAFAEMIPDYLRSIGPCLIEGWGLAALPDHYVRTLYFAHLPLFWHVDLWCVSDVHVDGSDLKAAYHWPQMFKIWIQELAQVLRGAENTEAVDAIAARWLDLEALPSEPGERLSEYLNHIYRRASSKGAPCEAFFSRCDELRREYLKHGTVTV